MVGSRKSVYCLRTHNKRKREVYCLSGVSAVCCESITNRKTLLLVLCAFVPYYPTHPVLNDLTLIATRPKVDRTDDIQGKVKSFDSKSGLV